jgi:hypothetical protein
MRIKRIATTSVEKSVFTGVKAVSLIILLVKNKCAGGETGIHAGLKILSSDAGSIPARRTVSK